MLIALWFISDLFVNDLSVTYLLDLSAEHVRSMFFGIFFWYCWYCCQYGTFAYFNGIWVYSTSSRHTTKFIILFLNCISDIIQFEYGWIQIEALRWINEHCYTYGSRFIINFNHHIVLQRLYRIRYTIWKEKKNLTNEMLSTTKLTKW